MRSLATKVFVALALCTTLAPLAGAQDAAQADRMRAALAAPERSADNKARDANRKPVETVQFLGIKTGDTVIDMIAAAGWFTEVLSAAVGPKGHVYMQNPDFFKQTDASKAFVARLGNTEELRVPLAKANLAGKVDAVVTAMNLHDIYNGFGDQPAGEAPTVAFVKEIYDVLKPGGVFGVVDHVGVAGQDNKKLHRMTTQQARDVLTKAGFKVEAESKLLANAADDHTKGVVDPSLRGHTDQFLFRARKPK